MLEPARRTDSRIFLFEVQEFLVFCEVSSSIVLWRFSPIAFVCAPFCRGGRDFHMGARGANLDHSGW